MTDTLSDNLDREPTQTPARLEYRPAAADEPSFRGYAAVLCAIPLGLFAMTILGYGMCFLQDEIVGQVVDSHYHAWLYTAPLAAAMSGTGLGLSVWVIRRRTPARPFAVFSLLLNAFPFGVFLLSLIGRSF
jgi:hypothetical protein